MNGIGQNILALRTQKGWSRKELADMVGKSEQQIYTWESGSRNPSHPNILKLIDAFGVTDTQFHLACKQDLCCMMDIFIKLPKSAQYRVKAMIETEWEQLQKKEASHD